MSESNKGQNRLDFDLRTRIAAVIDREVDGFWEPLDVADAVIRELDDDYILVPKSHTLARREKPPLFGQHLAVGDDGPIMLNINPKDADE